MPPPNLAILAHEAMDGGLGPDANTRNPMERRVLPSSRLRQLPTLDFRSGRAEDASLPVDDDRLFPYVPDKRKALRVTTADDRNFTAQGRCRSVANELTSGPTSTALVSDDDSESDSD